MLLRNMASSVMSATQALDPYGGGWRGWKNEGGSPRASATPRGLPQCLNQASGTGAGSAPSRPTCSFS